MNYDPNNINYRTLFRIMRDSRIKELEKLRELKENIAELHERAGDEPELELIYNADLWSQTINYLLQLEKICKKTDLLVEELIPYMLHDDNMELI